MDNIETHNFSSIFFLYINILYSKTNQFIENHQIVPLYIKKIKEHNIPKYIKKMITKINCIIISWLLFPSYYNYMVAILLLEDNIKILKKEDISNDKIILFIPWYLTNGLLNYFMIGSVINLFFTLILFTNQSMRLAVINLIVNKVDSIFQSEKYKLFLEFYNR